MHAWALSFASEQVTSFEIRRRQLSRAPGSPRLTPHLSYSASHQRSTFSRRIGRKVVREILHYVQLTLAPNSHDARDVKIRESSRSGSAMRSRVHQYCIHIRCAAA